MHMLGYPTHFGQMETLKLIASNGFAEKVVCSSFTPFYMQFLTSLAFPNICDIVYNIVNGVICLLIQRIGYLGLMILLDERQEVLMLVTNSLKNDLNSRNQYIVGLALTALGNICSAEMARDLGPELEKLLSSTNPYLRKKAALCACRVLRKIPDLLESFAEKVPDLLNDRNHAVILAGTTLMLEIIALESAMVTIFRDQVPILCRILRALMMGGFSAEYDVGGVANPYLQVKILRLLNILAHGSPEVSDLISDLLAQVATNTEGSRSSGNSILYECVKTIMAIENVGGLRVLAVNILGRFLSHRDNNIRYVALTILANVVAVDVAAVQRHRTTIVECVKDSDASIRRKALELVYALVNEGNIKSLTAELLDYLRVCDEEFKSDLTAKICMLVQKFAPDKLWYVDSMIRTFKEAGDYVKEDVCRSFLIVVLNSEDLHGYVSRELYRAIDSLQSKAAPSLVAVSLWCIGEYADILVQGSGRLHDEQEPDLHITEENLVELMTRMLQWKDLPIACHEYALTSLAKLSVRCPSTAKQVQTILDTHSTVVALEEQSRSVEYARLFDYNALRMHVLDHIPAAEDGNGDSFADNGQFNPIEEETTKTAVDLAALLGLDVYPAQDTTVVATSTPLDHYQNKVDQNKVGSIDQFAALLDNNTSATPAKTYSEFIAYENEALKINFKVSCGSSKGATDIIAEVLNKTEEVINGFNLQAAVPKFMQIKLEPATDSTLPARNSGSITQLIHIINSMEGEKPLVVRLRLTYSVQGKQQVHIAEVKSFPSNNQAVTH